MKTKIAKRDSSLIPEITQRLQAGEVIILPTDTVYAFVADAYNSNAINRIKKLKQFSHLQPMALFSRQEKAEEIVVVNRAAKQLMKHFPYPVTMIMPAKNTLPETVTNGFKNVFIVCPDRFIYDLIPAVSNPLVCAPVTVSTGVKATTFDMAVRFYEDKVPLIVDGGKSKYGQSGTLVDFTVEVPTILTFGTVSVDDLRPIIPEIVLPSHLMK
ncbi:L-threonylcarbamoyladenylate synthase [Myxosarcina sp. GI1(2024)]